MRIHSDKIQYGDLSTAAFDVSAHVNMECTTHGSRSRLRAFEVHLTWDGPKVPGDDRRHTNTGNQGSGGWALTWDEWGWFINALYQIDPQATIGPYNDVEHFYQLTERESQRVAAWGNKSAKRTHKAGWLPWRQEASA